MLLWENVTRGNTLNENEEPYNTRSYRKRLGLLREGSMEMKVYDLCDKTKTAEEIAKTLRESIGNVNSYIGMLKKKGLIRSSEEEGKEIYRQT
jgi:hypothetical protein